MATIMLYNVNGICEALNEDPHNYTWLTYRFQTKKKFRMTN